MMSLSDDKQADVLMRLTLHPDIWTIFETLVMFIKSNIPFRAPTEAAFLDLHLSIFNDIVSTKIYDKRDDFDFIIVNFPILDGNVPRSTSYRVYISQRIRFARASSYVTDFNTRTKL